jgi:alkanesulfonate monooxygenase SsuD/methylene tetrahydromethanopterin reductase-like flavin-dependent oxidoreductase (luciferase family)
MSASPFVIAIDVDGDGAHPSAWRVADHAPAELLTASTVAARVAEAERAGFSIVTFDDGPLSPSTHPDISARIDAVQRAAFVSPLTGAIGLVPVVNAVYTEPFHVATQLASLDIAAAGRAGWIVSSDADVRIAHAYGRSAVAAATARERATDAIEVARRLWDSWEDDAVIRDAATGRYLDRDKLHYAEFEGSDYSIVGPSIVPRSPQGQLPVFGPAGLAGQAELDVALLDADAVATDTATDAEAVIAAVASAVDGLRASGVPRLLLELEVILDHAGTPAERRLRELDRHTPWFSTGRARFAGDAGTLVDLLAGLTGLVDGVRLHPAVLHIDGEELGRAVLPALRARGLFSSPRPGDTLRDSLGLPRPDNRFAAAGTLVGAAGKEQS